MSCGCLREHSSHASTAPGWSFRGACTGPRPLDFASAQPVAEGLRNGHFPNLSVDCQESYRCDSEITAKRAGR
jgi:hypothetical protein